MSYLGSTGKISAIWRPEVDAETLKIRTTTARFVATGSVTNGHFGLFRWDMVAGTGGSGAHFHKTFSESFYVIETGRTLTDEEWTELYARHDQYMV